MSNSQPLGGNVIRRNKQDNSDWRTTPIDSRNYDTKRSDAAKRNSINLRSARKAKYSVSR